MRDIEPLYDCLLASQMCCSALAALAQAEHQMRLAQYMAAQARARAQLGRRRES